MANNIVAPEHNKTKSQATPEATTWGEYGRGGSGVAGAASTSPLPLPGFFSPASDSAAAPYLEWGDNPHAKVSSYANVSFDPRAEDWLRTNCAQSGEKWFIPGGCENGHQIKKEIACGKEWCPDCGKVGSVAHNRRYVRWLTKIRQLKTFQYWVFTVPEDLRARFRQADDLGELAAGVQKLMRRHGYRKGLMRWHFFGDKSQKWHPHLNVIVPGGFVNGDTIETIKDGYRTLLGVDVVNVNVTYKRTPAAMVKVLQYVTRATFKEWEWDPEMALELYCFRNMRVWGLKLWNEPPAWDTKPFTRIDKNTGEPADIDAIESIVEHECPVCHAELKWDKPVSSRYVDKESLMSLGAGYYMEPHQEHAPLVERETFSMTVRRRCTEERLKQIAARHRQLIGQGWRWRRAGHDIGLMPPEAG